MSGKPIRILHLEDDPSDGELVSAVLASDHIEATCVRVSSSKEYLEKLRQGGFDLILSDFSIPGYNGWSALDAALEIAPGVPFVFVSGHMGEELAIDSLKRGATDYVIKTRLGRLTPCVVRTLREKEEAVARRKAEADLISSVTKFQATFENAAVGIAHVSLEGRWILVNHKLTEILGYSEGELRETDFASITYPDDLEPDLANTRRLLDGKIPSYMMDKRYIRKDGRVVWVSLSVSLIRREDGSPEYFIAIVQDISGRKEAEDALTNTTHRLTLMAEVSDRLLKEEDPSDIIQELCQGVMMQLGCDIFLNYLIDQPTGRLRLHASAGLSEELTRKIAWMDPGQPVCGQAALERRRIVIADDPEDDDPRIDLIKRFGLRSYCGDPLMAGERVLGTLSFGSSRHARLSEEMLGVMRIVADQVAVAIHHTEAAVALRSSQQLLLLAQQAAMVGNFEWNVSLGKMNWSPELESLHGLIPGQFGGTYADWKAWVHPEDWPSVEERMSNALQGGKSVEGEWRVVWPDGTVRWLESRAMVFYDEKGAAVRVIGVNIDVTSRKRHQEMLMRANEDLEQRVAERTWELVQANRELRDQMVERRRLEIALLQISEHERRSVGQDLHDGLCQKLTGMSFMTMALAERLKRVSMETEAEQLSQVTELLGSAVNEARDVAKGLHPVELDNEGLISALYELAEQTSAKVPCQFMCSQTIEVPDESIAQNLYRIAQEATVNAIKHAKPRQIQIHLSAFNGCFVLSITDDGVGLPASPRKKMGMGIRLMNYRASVIGGTFSIQKNGKSGTTVTCKVPMEGASRLLQDGPERSRG